MNERILVVEDEAITALDLKYSLEEIGYEVIDTVDTGQDAIDIAEEKRPDVVLMDIKLKGDMEGFEAAEVISQWNIPIIYLTANTDIETFEQSNVKGVYGFVSKPYDLNKLNETLKDTFEKVKSEKITDA
ncbi:response regulator [Methanobrevibacter sp.]|uniref:response regulator n=1 Tax=Methanobrevibacter sp. TaxID=66852 RepID=UPI003864603F